MNIFTRTFVIVAAACLFAAIIAPALAVDARPVDRPFDVADAMKVATHDALAEVGVVKIQALADLLEGVTDESGARDRLAAVERHYLELELLRARMRMLPPPAPGQATGMDVRGSGYAGAKQALDIQVRRISDVPPIARVMTSIIAPLRTALDDSPERPGVGVGPATAITAASP